MTQTSKPAGIRFRKVLMIHSTAIGDFVIALRVIQSLRRACPVDQVQLLGKDSMIDLARTVGLIDSGRNIESAGWHDLFSGPDRLPEDCRTYLHGFDLIINMLAGPGQAVSQHIENITAGDTDCVIHIEPKPPADYLDHAAQYLFQQFYSQWPQSAGPAPRCDLAAAFEIADEMSKQARDTIADLINNQPRKPLIAIHPGASSAQKRWPTDRYLQLIRTIRNHHTVLLILGEVELEQVDPHQLDALNRSAHAVVGCVALSLLAGMLACCDAYIGNDSGITHLAGSIGIPTLTIFGPTDDNVWRPLGPNVTVVRADNLDMLSVDEVLQHVPVV